MAYVGIDAQGARSLGELLRETANQAEATRRQTVGALELADLTSPVPTRLTIVQEGLATLGAGIVDKADIAERFAIDPQRTAASLGAARADLNTALAALLGFAGPRDLRTVFVGLPPAGTDPALDAALNRLAPALLPALLAGQRPELTDDLLPDLRLLAIELGIQDAGPPALPQPELPERDGFLGFFRRRAERERTTEVFWQEFWSDGSTVDQVLADPDRLLDWVAGTFELDHRLSRAAGLPGLDDMLMTHDFATANSDPAQVEAMLAAARAEFAAILEYLPSYLVGRSTAAPDAAQLAQTLAFAARAGWTDPGPTAATPALRFDAAVAYLRANRLLQSALLPTGFAGDKEPLAFFNAEGIALTLQLGLQSGVIDPAYTTAMAELVDRALAAVLGDTAAAGPIELTEPVQQVLFALVAGQIPRELAQSPAIQAQFVSSLSYLRGATDLPRLRERVVEVVAAFRTLAVVGAPALTERQLTAVVGGDALGVLGRSRLRLRGEGAVRDNPEFLILARQWGIPGSQKQKLGKYTLGFTFDDLGVLTSISRKKQKKKSFFGRVVDTIKSIGKAIVTAWKDNPFKAIFQVGKIALGVASLVVPGLQVVGLASLAVNAVEAVSHAIDGNWLGAIGAGLGALVGGADLLGTAAGAALITGQSTVLGDLFGSGAALEALRNAKRAFDIGTSVIQATRADSLAGAIGAGLGAVASTLGNGGKLLESLDVIDASFAQDLVRLGTSVRDVARLVGPGAGLVQALERGDALSAFSNGLSVISAGAAALVNPAGVLGDPKTVTGTSFDFDARTRADLATLAAGTGIAANLARAIAAVDAGSPFAAGQALAQAVQLANRLPQPGAGPVTAPGTGGVDPTEVAKRVAEVGIVLEAVFRGANPNLAAPIVLQRLNGVIAALRPSAALPGAAGPISPISPIDPTSPPGSAGQPGSVGQPATFEAVTLVAPPASIATLSGTAGGELLSGTAGAELLSGTAGAELLSGTAGADVLAGADGGGSADDGRLARIDLVDDLPPGVDLRFYERLPDPPPLHPLGLLFADPPTGEPPYVWAAQNNPAFVPNHVLDGGARTKEFILPFFGWGASAQGPFNASESVYVGVELGGQIIDNPMPPVDGVSVSLTASTGGQFGKSGALVQGAGEVNFGPILDLELPDGTTDYMAGVNAPGDGAAGFRTTGGVTRPLESSDFPDAAYLGPAVMLGIKYPIYDDLALSRIAEIAEVSEEDVLLARQLPPGSTLAFDVRDGFGSAFDPGFGARPGFDAPFTEPVDGFHGAAPDLTGIDLPDGFSVDVGAPLGVPADLSMHAYTGAADLALSPYAHDEGVSVGYLDDVYDTMIALGAPSGSTVDFDHGDDFWSQFESPMTDDLGAPPLMGPATLPSWSDDHVDALTGDQMSLPDGFSVDFGDGSDPGAYAAPGGGAYDPFDVYGASDHDAFSSYDFGGDWSPW